jgi:hypothetical protein
MKKWMSLACFLVLANCASPQERAAEIAAQQRADQSECTHLGFRTNTDAFSNCLLKLQEIRAQKENTDAIERANAPRPWGPWGPYSPWGPYY